MKTRITSIIFLSCLPVFVSFAQIYHTEIFSKDIKTLRVGLVDNAQHPPVIELEGGNQVEVCFDELGEQPQRYTYTLTHCNADWTASNLVQSEYMSGFQNSKIDDYNPSFNTTMDFIHYKLFFPNSDLTMKISGNYVVKVFSEENQKQPVLTACFSVYEPKTNVRMTVSTRTDIDVNRSHQQLSFEVVNSGKVNYSAQDLKVYAFQNNRRDNCAALIQPMSVQYSKLVYDHNPKLIFDAGNEYRRLEMTSSRFNGMGMAKIEFHSPYFHVDLKPDINRSQRPYEYAEELNGGFVVRDIKTIEHDYEADYFFVHFYLPCDRPFPDDVYLLGEVFNNRFNEQSKMEYSAQDKGYVKTLLLKEGYYNYMYVTKKADSPAGNTSLIEGNFYQTDNNYSVRVYYRPPGARYDRLIGFSRISLSSRN